MPSSPQKPRTLPTRKSELSTSTDEADDNAPLSTLKSAKNTTTKHTRKSSKQSTTTAAESRHESSNGNSNTASDEGEKRTPSSPNDASEMIKPAFVMGDVGTIDDVPLSSSAPPPPSYTARRAASPSSVITSRRGRSRSPVGIPMHHGGSSSNNNNNSRPASRTGSNGRASSRSGNNSNGRASPRGRSPPPEPTAGLSSVAIAAGEAAAAAKRGPSPYIDNNGASHATANNRARSPSPTTMAAMQINANPNSANNQWPLGASFGNSFEMSPMLGKMGDNVGLGFSFSMPLEGGNEGSFDWNGGVHNVGGGRRSPSPPPREYHHHHGQHRQEQGCHQPPPPPPSHYGHPKQSDYYHGSTYYDGGYHEQQRYEHHGYDDRTRYERHSSSPDPHSYHHSSHHRHHVGGDVLYETRYHRHHSGSRNGSPSQQRSRARSASPSSGHLRRNSQPLYSEHHILSTSSKDNEHRGRKRSGARSSSSGRSGHYHRQSTQEFRDAPTPTHGNHYRSYPPSPPPQQREASSVFRGVPEHERGASNMVPALQSWEDSPVQNDNCGMFVEEIVNSANSKIGGRLKGTIQHSSKKSKTSAKSKKGSAKNSTTHLPEQLMLALDDSPPNSPRQDEKISLRSDGDNNAATSSPVNNGLMDSGAIDKELSAALDVDNLCGVDGDYLSNLSFRKSYDLEQVFSFMKSPKGSNVEASGGFGGMIDLKLGSLSFTNSFGGLMGAMSASGEEKVKEDGKATSKEHRRHPSSGNHSRRSPMGIPNNHTLTSQTSTLGLSPINSFSGDNGGIVPLTNMDGMALRSFFSSSPSANEGVNGPSSSYNNQPHPPSAHVLHVSTPPSYGSHPHPQTYEHPRQPNNRIVHRSNHPVTTAASSTVDTPLEPLASNKRIKLSASSGVQPVLDLSKRADIFMLLKRLAPAFEGFQYKLQEIDQTSGFSYDVSA